MFRVMKKMMRDLDCIVGVLGCVAVGISRTRLGLWYKILSLGCSCVMCGTIVQGDIL